MSGIRTLEQELLAKILLKPHGRRLFPARGIVLREPETNDLTDLAHSSIRWRVIQLDGVHGQSVLQVDQSDVYAGLKI